MIPDEIEFRGMVYFQRGPAREDEGLAQMEASMLRTTEGLRAVVKRFGKWFQVFVRDPKNW